MQSISLWKIYDFKIEVIHFSTELTTVVQFDVYVQKWCGRSCICGLFNFQLWRIKRPQIQLLPHHFWTVLKFMINGTTSILKSWIFQICAAIYQLLLHMVFTSRYVKLKALASWIFFSFTSFWRNSDSYEYTNKLARRGVQFVPIGMLTKRNNSQSFQS
jgi:hypothetical protein